MATDKNALLEDAGEYIPYAKKHNAELRGKQGQDNVTLADLWPEPDWKELVANGMSAELAVAKFIGYNSIRNKARNGGVHRVSGAAWLRAYRTSVLMLKSIYEDAQMVEAISDINSRLREKAGYTVQQLKIRSVEENILFWAAGMGGDSRLKSVGSRTLRLSLMGRCLAKMGWPVSDAAWKSSIVPAKLTNGTYVVGRIEGNKLCDASKPFATEDEAYLAAIEKAESEIAGKKLETKLVPKRPSADKDIQRVGPDYRNGADISPENLMSEFNLRAIQFGNSVSVKDRQRWLNQTYDALADLSDVLKMKRKWLGLSYQERSLALAIGARGQGAFAAHYEPALKVINQTYKNGAGALGHEFGHGLDHRLGNTFGDNHKYSTYLAMHPHSNGVSGEKNLSIAHRISDIGRMCGTGTVFYKQSEKIGRQHRAGNYWTKVEELFARSFEAFVQDSLIAVGRSNPWLVHGTLAADYELSTVAACPYPVGEERIQLFHAFRLLIEAMLAKGVRH